MVRHFLKRSVKRGGDRARLNQERIFQTWTLSPMVKYSMIAKTRYLNHKLKSEEIKSTMLEAVSGTGKGIKLG